MSDQMKWFKLWYSAGTDDDLIALPPADRWAWAMLGAHTKVHGTAGKVAISTSNAALAGMMGIPLNDLVNVIKRLPHVTLNDTSTVNGRITVTWHKWSKFQVDSSANRVARHRQNVTVQRRGEENPPTPQKQQPSRPMTSGEFADERERVYQLSLRKPKAPA